MKTTFIAILAALTLSACASAPAPREYVVIHPVYQPVYQPTYRVEPRYQSQPYIQQPYYVEVRRDHRR